MDSLFLPKELKELKKKAQIVGHEVLAPEAERVDKECAWPRHSLKALGEIGLLGLHVPQRLGGLEQGLFGLTIIGEELGRHCSSSAMCFAMHSVATAVIAAKATAYQEDCYLLPIVEGKHVTTLALSEPGSGSFFFVPQIELTAKDENYYVKGKKSFVTNGGFADSYVLSTKASNDDCETGEFSCLILDGQSEGVEWDPDWAGFGLRGNSSKGFLLNNALIPKANLLGSEGDQTWYVFEVVAPYFLAAMTGVYLGMCTSALEYTIDHIKKRQYSGLGSGLADADVIQHRIAELWVEVEKARQFIYHASRLGDLGDPSAMAAICLGKATIGDTASRVVNEAMTLCGGMAYRDNSKMSRLLRDVRASHVMAPTTDILKLWAGRMLLDKPFL